jgi:hypothetical protein
MVFLQNKSTIKGSSIGVEDYPMLKLTSYMWIKRYYDCMPLTSINLCVQSVQSDTYERERQEKRRPLGERRGIERSILEDLGKAS